MKPALSDSVDRLAKDQPYWPEATTDLLKKHSNGPWCVKKSGSKGERRLEKRQRKGEAKKGCSHD